METKIYENHPSDSRITESKDGICQTLTSKMGTGGGNVPLVLMDQGGSQMSIETDKVGTLRAQEHGHQPIIMTGGFTGISEKVSPTIVAGMSHQSGTTQPIVFGKVSRPKGKDGLGERWDEIKIASTRNCMDIGDARTQEIVSTGSVRRLTPVECERLQGFPDNYTRIPYRGKPAEQCPDSPRYKAIGNSWAVPCVRWIGKRINQELDKE